MTIAARASIARRQRFAMECVPMTADPVPEEVEPIARDGERKVPPARNYFWRPWYAKAWWAGIPLYWLAMGDPTRPAFLDGFAGSGYVVFTNVIFLPITAILVLGFVYFRWLFEYGAPVRRLDRHDIGYGRRIMGRPHPSVDPYHPASPFYRYNPSKYPKRH